MKVQVFFDVQGLDDNGDIVKELSSERVKDLKDSLIMDGAELVQDGDPFFTFNMDFATAPVIGSGYTQMAYRHL